MGILIEFSMGGLVLESGPLLVCVRYVCIKISRRFACYLGPNEFDIKAKSVVFGKFLPIIVQ